MRQGGVIHCSFDPAEDGAGNVHLWARGIPAKGSAGKVQLLSVGPSSGEREVTVVDLNQLAAACDGFQVKLPSALLRESRGIRIRVEPDLPNISEAQVRPSSLSRILAEGQCPFDSAAVVNISKTGQHLEALGAAWLGVEGRQYRSLHERGLSLTDLLRRGCADAIHRQDTDCLSLLLSLPAPESLQVFSDRDAEVINWDVLEQRGRVLQAFLRCAREAIVLEKAERVQDELSATIRRVAEDSGLAAGFVRAVLSEFVPKAKREPQLVRECKVVLVEERGALERGLVAKARVDLFPRGSGEFFASPRLALHFWDSEFAASVALAQETVRKTSPDADVCFSLESLDGSVLPARLVGGSLGAALQLLLRALADPDIDLSWIVVSAKVDAHGRLKLVDGPGLKAKFGALLHHVRGEVSGCDVLFVSPDQDCLGLLKTGEQSALVPDKDRESTVVLVPEIELRSPRSLLIVRAASVDDLVAKARELEADAAVPVVADPVVCGSAVLAGSWWCLAIAFSLVLSVWYFVPGFWFVLVAPVVWLLGALVLPCLVRAPAATGMRLPRRTRRSPQWWRESLRLLRNKKGFAVRAQGRWISLLAKSAKANLAPRDFRTLSWGVRLWRRVALPLGLSAALLVPRVEHELASQLPFGTAPGFSAERESFSDFWVRGGQVRHSFHLEKEEVSGALVYRTPVSALNGEITLAVDAKPRDGAYVVVRSDAYCDLRPALASSGTNLVQNVMLPVESGRVVLLPMRSKSLKEEDKERATFELWCDLYSHSGKRLQSAKLFGEWVRQE
jgi:hypothetical protein